MEKSDRTLTCKDCGQTFVFTVREQEFYESKQFTDPIRCKECREKRKADKSKNKKNYNN